GADGIDRLEHRGFHAGEIEGHTCSHPSWSRAYTGVQRPQYPTDSRGTDERPTPMRLSAAKLASERTSLATLKPQKVT
ncbi:MAG TPA: hypothetical protein VIK61_15585, partial [Acidimicrobiia bacterium]